MVAPSDTGQGGRAMPENQNVITSTSNRRIVEARKLSQRKHRQRQGRFMVEGLQILHMALDAGQVPAEAFYCEAAFTGTEAPYLLERLSDMQSAGGGPALHPVSEAVLDVLCQRQICQGLVAILATFETPISALRLNGDRLVVILDRLRDPGNLGALIRVADAVGAGGVVALEPCADIFDPQVVRSSMGSLFNIPVIRTGDTRALFEHVRRAGLRAVAADPYVGTLWGTGLWDGGVALVLGNEAQGLSPDVRVEVESWARLPMVGKAESLNVAVAGGILMYSWLAANYHPNAAGNDQSDSS